MKNKQREREREYKGQRMSNIKVESSGKMKR